MLLAADVGNTNVTVGAFEGGRLRRLWRLATDPRKTSDEYAATLRGLIESPRRGGEGRPVDGFAIGSVVPALTPTFERVAREHFGVTPLVVGPSTPLGLKLKVDEPRQVGADRILNALAAWKLYGAPAVVLDFGTATTFDCLSARGEYLGGAILIGPELIARALAENTAKLPRVAIKPARRFIARSTEECIQVGLYHGYLGMVERVLDETLRELRAPRARVLATGGLAGLFADGIKRLDRVAPDLTLQGLRLAHELSGTRRKRTDADRR